MTPLEFLVLLVVTVIAIAGISQIPLVSDVVSHSGYSATEVWGGVSSIVLFFYAFLAIFTMRT